MAGRTDTETIAPEAEMEARSEQQPLTTVVLLVLVMAVLWGASIVVDCEAPIARAGTPEHWFFFIRQILRDILRGVALVSLALAVSAVLPSLGLRLRALVFSRRRRLVVAVCALAAVASSAAFSYFVLGHMPHIQDEIAMLFQAKVLASGRLYAPTPPLVEFFDYEFVLVDGPRWYGKYFFGPSLLMAPGVWLGVPWLISPLLAGVAVLLTYLIVRRVFNTKVALVVALLMAISPFRVSLFSMMMAHPATLVAMALFTLAVVHIVENPASVRWAAVAGAAIGFAVNCRPLTAVAMGVVICAVAAFKLPWRRLRWTTVAAFLLPSVAFALAFLGYNRALTGDAFTTAFTKWCPSDHLGFGPDVGLDYMPPQDLGHSWRKAIFRNSTFSLDAVGTFLTGWGHITLLLLIWPILWTPWKRRAWAAAAIVASLVVSYAFYYTPSVFAGQARYWSESMPMMLVLVGLAMVNLRLLLPRLCLWLGFARPVRTGAAACWLTGALWTVMGVWLAYVPLYDECANMYWGQGPGLRDAVEEAGLENALVFLPADHFREGLRKLKWDVYGSGFALNDPDMKGPVVFARDLGDARNAELLALPEYRGRSLYWIDLSLQREARLLPLSEAPAARRPR